MLDSEGLLDIVVWVDICNEFPLPPWCPQQFAEIVGTDSEKGNSWDIKVLSKLVGKWNEKQVSKLNDSFIDSIKPIKEKYPDLKYTFSFQGFGSKNYIKGDTSVFDLAEPHIWATDNLNWSLKTSFFGTLVNE